MNELKMKKDRKPTLKQKAFVRALLNTNNATEAARQAKYNGNENTLNAIASENLGKPKIQELIRDMKQRYVNDSYEAYEIQKAILRNSVESDNPMERNFELANKIANKIQDRAGFMPVAKQESKSISMKYVISRGQEQDDTSLNSTKNSSLIEE